MPAAEAERVAPVFDAIVARRESFAALENINRHKDGRLVILESSGVPVLDEQDQLLGYRGIDRDITERKRAEMLLAEERRVLEMIARGAPLQEVLETLICTFEQQARERLFGSVLLLDADGRHLRLGAAPNLPMDYNRAIEGTAIGPQAGSCGTAAYFQAPVIVTDIARDPLWADFRALALQYGLQACWSTPILSAKGKVLGTFAIYYPEPRSPSDEEVTLIGRICNVAAIAIEREQAEESLATMAYYDILTGLPNRTLLQDRLAQSIAHSRRQGLSMAVLFLDLDGFKQINDTLGHEAGDQFLVEVAARLREHLRAGDTVARLGGDEFVLVVDDVAQDEEVAPLAERILEALARPVLLAGQELFVTTSIGISVFPRDGEDVTTLLKHADTAMYQAKAQGRNRYQFYTPAMNAEVVKRLTLSNQLRRALERDEFCLHYQPQVDTASGRVLGVEALLRWQHPERGLVAPGDFIPLLEETGLIVPVGEWALHSACAQASAWQRQGFAGLRIAVNLSGRQFRQQHLLRTVAQALDSSGLRPEHLELELTESLLMQDPVSAAAVLQALTAMRVSVALDDFGTGYSSLNYLQRFPIHTVKIDRAFVADILENPRDRAIITAIITMAHSLGLKVVGEGVETAGQLDLLRQLRCDEVQGYYFSRPLAADQLPAFLEASTLMPA
ncbi:EAL domain-containing protein [Thermithiobacillus tepidarius DSM 3134]|uniref:putative bifunctional diguanylate cyclase/phosphodiesterase n=1 Tax=Thermithiobacillus tepidarius TaxID=929 RepID=UPI000414FFFF|nr:EAL domain-containing protein [Thermithiobacillus tepidarius]